MDHCAKNGFYFHHAHEKKGYVLMMLWLDATVPNRMPMYAHHYIGVGGAVINKKREIMLIKEHRSLDSRKWKLPGGFMDLNEKVSQAVEREVREETGIVAKFVGIVGLREQLNFKYDCTDFYFVTCLTPVDENNTAT